MASCVLVVEDEPLIGIMLEQMLDELGYVTVGPAATSEAAVRLLHVARVDLALLDINLGQHRTSRDVAEVLALRGIPFAFVTGYEHVGWEGALSEVKLMRKPFSVPELGNLLT